MSILRISEFDETHSHCLFVIMTSTTVEQIIISWKNCDIRLNQGIAYSCVLVDLSDFHLSYVTISTDSLPYDEFLLPLFPEPNNANFDLESLKFSTKSLKVTHDPKPEQYISIDINYEIDNEPLVLLSQDKAHNSFECHNESIVSDAYCAKIENYEILVEKEEKLRKVAELKLLELFEDYEKMMQRNRDVEDKMRSEIQGLEMEKLESFEKIQELSSKLCDAEYKTKKMEDLVHLNNIKMKIFDYDSLKEEYVIIKRLYENSEKKMQEIIEKLENHQENDPITLVLKEKEEIINKKSEEIQKLMNSKPDNPFAPLSQEIEKKLKELNLEFNLENELVYSINSQKLSVSLKESTLIFRKLSGFISPSDFTKNPHHIRSKTDNKSLLSSIRPSKPINSPVRIHFNKTNKYN